MKMDFLPAEAVNYLQACKETSHISKNEAPLLTTLEKLNGRAFTVKEKLRRHV